MAQHHRVPTRLLDFTYQPNVAAYFAATACLRAQEQKSDPESFSVWAVDLRFFLLIRELSSRFSGGSDTERIREINSPKHNNEFLRAQSGFFLIDEQANRYWDRPDSKPLENALIERTTSWERRTAVWERRGKPLGSEFFVPYVKITIPAGLAKEVLERLHDEGTNEASIYPSYDHIHMALQFMDRHGHQIE